MGKGGARAGAGRPPGARDSVPRGGKKYDRLKSMSQSFDSNEYLFTNQDKVFKGDALDLIKAIYKAEQIPGRVRLYAAAKPLNSRRAQMGRERPKR